VSLVLVLRITIKISDFTTSASFVGGITIPLALVLLGASFARLKIPRPVSRLALPAMFAVALAKMLVLPIVGVFMVQAMVYGGLIPGSVRSNLSRLI
jgi:predicted permease